MGVGCALGRLVDDRAALEEGRANELNEQVSLHLTASKGSKLVSVAAR